MNLVSRIEANILPRAFIKRFCEEPRESVASRFADTNLLVISLDRLDDELTLGLEGADMSDATPLVPSHDALGYGTVVTAIGELIARAAEGPPSSKYLTRAASGLAKDLAEGLRFIVPLRKRKLAGKSFTDRISVGRARNNDIVLRHASVSKFHAWFQSDDQANFFLGDARSTNTTMVRGAIVAPGDLVPIKPGDAVRFGSVAALLCKPDALWDAIATPA